MARGISNKNRDVGGGRGIEYACEGLETTTYVGASTTMTAALTEEDELAELNDDDGGVNVGYMTRPGDWTTKEEAEAERRD